MLSTGITMMKMNLSILLINFELAVLYCPHSAAFDSYKTINLLIQHKYMKTNNKKPYHDTKLEYLQKCKL